LASVNGACTWRQLYLSARATTPELAPLLTLLSGRAPYAMVTWRDVAVALGESKGVALDAEAAALAAAAGISGEVEIAGGGGGGVDAPSAYSSAQAAYEDSSSNWPMATESLSRKPESAKVLTPSRRVFLSINYNREQPTPNLF
jgi:hypothetical protein